MKALALLLSITLARGVHADAGVSVIEDYVDADAGIYTVESATLRDGGTVVGPGYFITPAKAIRIATHATDLENRNARLLSEKEALALELDRARVGRPLFSGGFWTGMAIGSVVTVLVVGGTALWIGTRSR